MNREIKTFGKANLRKLREYANVKNIRQLVSRSPFNTKLLAIDFWADRYNQDVKENRRNKRFVSNLRTRLTKNQDATIRSPSKERLRLILTSFHTKPFPDKNVIFEADDVIYELNKMNSDRILNDIDRLFVIEDENVVGSDPRLILAIRSFPTVSIQLIPISKNKQGAFFPYYHTVPYLDLSRYLIYWKDAFDKDYSTNCFIHSLKMGGVEEGKLKEIMCYVLTRDFPQRKIKEVAEKFNLYIQVKSNTSNMNIRHYGNKKQTPIKLGLVEKHYFLIERTNITKYALHNAEKNTKGFNYCPKGNAPMNSYRIVMDLLKHKDDMLERITKDIDTISSSYHSKCKLEANPNQVDIEETIRYNEPKDTSKKEVYPIVFFDFETITNEKRHLPYMVCAKSYDETYEKTFTGYNCANDFMYDLSYHYPNGVRLIAHNLSYDFAFIVSKLKNIQLIKRGSNVMSGTGVFYYKKGTCMKVQLLCSYALIHMPLSKFGKCFNLEQEKEIMDYELYTIKNVNKRYIPSKKVRSDVVEKAKEWNCVSNGKVDIMKYAELYCVRDVDVLCAGYKKFRNDIMKVCELDINHFVSEASIANEYMVRNECFRDCYSIGGSTRSYIQRCVVGGRTMVSNNEKKIRKGRILDFDAVSLYPSAMYRLGGYLQGIPKALTNKSYSFLQSCDGYFIRIKINKVGTHRAFPAMSYVNDLGVRNWTNDMVGREVFVDKISLEDYIQFHNIEFEVIDGYYYDEGRNYKLGSLIETLFNKRLQYKKEKNPIQSVFKLIMNSSYGKTCLKEISTDTKYMYEKEKVMKYILKNFDFINCVTKINDDGGKYGVWEVKEYKTIDDHYNNVYAGCEILSMSKRIMNEVMYLAEDNGIELFYLDTDSIHLYEKDIEPLCKLYEDKYGKILIGKQMGQFHSDFESKIIKDDIHATKSIFLGKKCYLDILEGKDKNGLHVKDYHIRMKGVSQASILYKGIDLEELYTRLYKGELITFDLTCGGNKACFESHNDFSKSTRKEFNRVLSF